MSATYSSDVKPGARVVDRDQRAAGDPRPQPLAQQRVVEDRVLLGELDHEPRRQLARQLEQPRMAERLRREVDPQQATVGRDAGGGDRPPAGDLEVVADARAGRGGERHIRREGDQAGRRGEARQALVADRPEVREPDDRLEHGADRAGFQQHPEVVCGAHPFGRSAADGIICTAQEVCLDVCLARRRRPTGGRAIRRGRLDVGHDPLDVVAFQDFLAQQRIRELRRGARGAVVSSSTARRIASSARCCCSASRSSRVRSETAPPSAVSCSARDRGAHRPLVDHRREISATCWRSSDAPVVTAPKTSCSAARPAEQDRHLVDQLGPRLEVAVLLREVQHVAERLAARDDRDLVRAVDARQQLGAERVAGLVEGDHAALVLGQHAARLHAGHDPLERAVEVLLVERAAVRRGRRRSRPRWRCWPGRRRSGPRSGARSSTGRRSSTGLLRVWTFRIASRPVDVGRRRRGSGGRSAPGAAAPGRASRAGWTPRSRPARRCEAKPSISTSSWLSVCSRSELLSEPRSAPTASISSMKTIAGECLRASRNSRRMRLAPRPANISTKLDADWEKNCAPDSLATALASSVLPVPGGPCRRMPLGTVAPERRKRFGSLRKSTTSCSSALASSAPATSSHLIDAVGVRLDLLRLGVRHHPHRPPEEEDDQRHEDDRPPQEDEALELFPPAHCDQVSPRRWSLTRGSGP